MVHVPLNSGSSAGESGLGSTFCLVTVQLQPLWNLGNSSVQETKTLPDFPYYQSESWSHKYGMKMFGLALQMVHQKSTSIPKENNTACPTVGESEASFLNMKPKTLSFFCKCEIREPETKYLLGCAL